MKNFSIKIFIALLALAGVITVASAQVVPPSTPPGGNVFPPINIGDIDQTKNAGITAQFFAGKKGLFKFPGTFCSGGAVYACNNIFEALSTGFLGNPEKGISVNGSGSFFIRDGNQAAGKVLTSNADGMATWQTPGGGTPPPTGAASCSITATPNYVAFPGQPVTLNWAVSGATGIFINNGVGNLTNGTFNGITKITTGTVTINPNQAGVYSGITTGHTGNPGLCDVTLDPLVQGLPVGAPGTMLYNAGPGPGNTSNWRPGSILNNNNQHFSIRTNSSSDTSATMRVDYLTNNVSGDKGRNILDAFLAGSNASEYAQIRTNSRGFRLQKIGIGAGGGVFNEGDADLMIGKIRVTGGGAGTGRVLTSVDPQGNAEWRDLSYNKVCRWSGRTSNNELVSNIINVPQSWTKADCLITATQKFNNGVTQLVQVGCLASTGTASSLGSAGMSVSSMSTPSPNCGW